MEPQSVSEVGEDAESLVFLKPHFRYSPGDESAEMSLGEIVQVVILRCALRTMEAREAASSG